MSARDENCGEGDKALRRENDEPHQGAVDEKNWRKGRTGEQRWERRVGRGRRKDVVTKELNESETVLVDGFSEGGLVEVEDV